MGVQSRLPDHYQHYSSLNLSRKRILLVMALVGSVLVLLFGWFFVTVALVLRPAATSILTLFTPTPTGGFTVLLPLVWIVGALITILLVIIVHEAVHGIVFWIFTRKRPQFGFKGLYAYAAAPKGVYMRRNPYLVVGIAPFVILTAVGLILVPLLPLGTLPFLVCFLAFNAAGAVGDGVVTAWLLRFPSTVLVEDVGDAMIIYGPAR